MDKGFIANYFDFSQINLAEFQKALFETLYMTGVAIFCVIILGLLIGLKLFYFSRSQNPLLRFLYMVVSLISNTFRSIPFIILIILLFPITKLLLGSTFGPSAALPALVISAAPFYARLVDIAFKEVDSGVLEAADAMGASKWQVIVKVLIPESLPALVSGIVVTTISMIGFSAMAGAIGAGGLGSLAYQVGFMRNRPTVILVATILILLIVFIIQWAGDGIVKKLDKRS